VVVSGSGAMVRCVRAAIPIPAQANSEVSA
jgi:hypothetical protein